MFTGIIQAIGKITAIQKNQIDCRLTVEVATLDTSSVKLGDSIAVNGVCLTVIALDNKQFTSDVSHETLSLTTLGNLKIGAAVNLEKALCLSTPLGGHLVSGHVDGVGEIVNRTTDGSSERFVIETPPNLAKYIAQKGSVCIDGISLTVNKVDGVAFELNIVPHTLQQTIMGQFKTGQLVNIEVDLLARYLERLMLGDDAAKSKKSANLTESFLKENGFS